MSRSNLSQALIVGCLLAALLLASGCTALARSRPSPTAGSSGTANVVAPAFTPTVEAQPPGPVKQRTVRFAAGPADTEQYKLAQLIAAVWSQRIPGLKVNVVASEGMGPNLRLLDAGSADVILVRDDLAVTAANRLPPFSDRAIKTASLGAIYWDVVQILAAVDSGVAEARDLWGRRVAFPHWDSAAMAMLNQVLGPGKFAYGDFGSVIQVPDDQAAAAFLERRVDVVMLAGPLPSPALQQAAAQRPVHVVAVAEGWRDLVRRQYPTFSEYVVPAGTYAGQGEDVATVGARTILAVRLDADEELVSLLAAALVEGFVDIADGSPIARDFAPEDLTRAVRTPFHPGAVQGYLQKGLFK